MSPPRQCRRGTSGMSFAPSASDRGASSGDLVAMVDCFQRQEAQQRQPPGAAEQSGTGPRQAFDAKCAGVLDQMLNRRLHTDDMGSRPSGSI